MPLPSFDENGDLPLGIHRATLSETLKHFCTGSRQRQIVATRLERIHRLALSTGQVSRFVVFGSFITAKKDFCHILPQTYSASRVAQPRSRSPGLSVSRCQHL